MKLKPPEDKQLAFFILVGITLAFYIRLSLFPYSSFDFECCLQRWYATIRAGGFWALRSEFSDYSPLYLMVLMLFQWLFPKLPDLFAIKFVSITFDFIAAALVYQIVRLKYPQKNIVPIMASLLFLFVPTVLLNSAFWGQIDIGYTSMLLAFMYFLLRKSEALAMLFLGIAFSFKLQVIFIFPLVSILILKGQLDWKKLFIAPGVYILSLIPAWIAGRPLGDLLTIYLNQAEQHDRLSLLAPTIYAWLPDSEFNILYVAGLILAFSLMFLFIVFIARSRVELTNDLLVYLALTSLVLAPFFLPKMHERYFYAADVFSILFLFYFPKKSYIVLPIPIVSLFAYFMFLFGITVIPLPYLSIALMLVLSALVFGSPFWQAFMDQPAQERGVL